MEIILNWCDDDILESDDRWEVPQRPERENDEDLPRREMDIGPSLQIVPWR